MLPSELEAASPTTPDEEALRAWDWKADLDADERSIPWLARKTDRADRTVYGYSRGEITPTIDWLRAAWRVLRGRVANPPAEA